ncbi:MAG: hypothetical protein JO048_04390, partial [Methylobacteriaceae bacterium]|nr:hypothetical protein [Methylobacteriaceae bacterium]
SGAYLAAVAGAVGVDPQTIVGSLDSSQLDRLAQAIQRHEGWKPGTIEPIQGLAASPLGAALAPAAAGLALSGDAARIPRLIELGADPEQCREIRERAFAAMTRIYGKPTARNACACTLSMFLRASGVDVEVEYGAGNLARILEKERGWQRVPVGQQQPGDVGVTQDRLPPAGADHIYLVVARLDADRMLIADNQQASAPHPRWASGQTPTAYFLRAPGDGAGFAPFGLTTSDEIVTDDEDTNGLLIRFDESGAPL